MTGDDIWNDDCASCAMNGLRGRTIGAYVRVKGGTSMGDGKPWDMRIIYQGQKNILVKETDTNSDGEGQKN